MVETTSKRPIGMFAFKAIGLAGYFVPAIYNAETILPDHDALAKAELA